METSQLISGVGPTMRRTMRGRAIGAVLALLLLWPACRSGDSDLPAIRGHAPAVGCPEGARLLHAGEVANGGDGLWSCRDAARRSGCSGAIRFDVEVDEVGRNTIVRWVGSVDGELRSCIETAVADAALGPATDCHGTFIRTITRGSVSWRFGDSGYSASLANVGGIIPALDPSCRQTGAHGQ
jgi:hypothetical protein